MIGTAEIGPGQLVLALGFVLAAGGASLWLKLGLGRDILVGTVRTFGQLFLMGYVLVYIFEWRIPWLTLLLFCGMIFFAARIVAGRVKGLGVPVFKPVLVSMLLSYLVVSYLVVAVVGLHGQGEARAYRAAIYEHCAGPAVALVAADLGACEPQLLAQHLGQALPRLHRHTVVVAVHSKFYQFFGHSSPSRMGYSLQKGNKRGVCLGFGLRLSA